jgi:hypothetical protein
MAIRHYLSLLVKSPEDDSILEPMLYQAFPDQDMTVTDRATDPTIPVNYVIVTIEGCTANEHRANLAVPYTSEWK